jgi:hypothetical protein
MDSELLQFSVVVRGDSHNPTILNPDFLAIQGIVPHAWGWEVAQPVITTPMMAIVQYATGVSIQVQSENLQVAAAGEQANPKRSKVPDIVRGYVTTLPHVRYTGLGINFHSAIIMENPAETIRDKFLKKGPWSTKRELGGAGVRLVYPLETSGRVLLSVDGGNIQQRGKDDKPVPRRAMLINANFHRDLPTHAPTAEISAQLDGIDADWALYQELLGYLLSSGE